MIPFSEFKEGRVDERVKIEAHKSNVWSMSPSEEKIVKDLGKIFQASTVVVEESMGNKYANYTVKRNLVVMMAADVKKFAQLPIMNIKFKFGDKTDNVLVAFDRTIK